jgi:hypothetical protein
VGRDEALLRDAELRPPLFAPADDDASTSVPGRIGMHVPNPP